VLGKIKDRRAIGPLIFALLDSEKIVQNAAWNSLDAIDPNWAESEEARKRVPDFISALKENDENLRITAVRALGKIKDARAVGPLISTLLISKLKDIKGDVVHFIPAIKDVNASVRREVAWALGEIKDARAVSSLISALKDSDKNVRKAAKEALEKIKESQILLVSSFPNLNLLCMRCYLRAEKRTARVGIFSSFQYVVCRRCGSSSYLREGVRKVVGMIGGEVKDYELRDGVLYLSLWTEEKKEGRNADIDILEIIDTEGISYDYAINVVIRTLKNDVDRKSDYLKNIPVIIKGNPPIPPGFMNLLQKEFKEIIKG
jgi:HEAT repeat protein